MGTMRIGEQLIMFKIAWAPMSCTCPLMRDAARLSATHPTSIGALCGWHGEVGGDVGGRPARVSPAGA